MRFWVPLACTNTAQAFRTADFFPQSRNVSSLVPDSWRISIEPSHHLILCHGCEIVDIKSLRRQTTPRVRRNQLVIQVWRDRKLCSKVSIGKLMDNQLYIPCREKSNSAGRSRADPPACRESGRRVLGSLSSSKKGWHMASIADNRSVGVYSRRAEMSSIASVEAFLNTLLNG